MECFKNHGFENEGFEKEGFNCGFTLPFLGFGRPAFAAKVVASAE
jgi:hypothetical protein